MRDKYRRLVHNILLDNHDARNSDKVLWDRVVKELSPKLAKMPLEKALMHEDLPSWNSVTRSRRYWQARDMGCMSDKQVARLRAKKELEYREEYGHGRR